MCEPSSPTTFNRWTSNRDLVSLGTNAGAERLAFQDWFHFKEAFTPELVERAVHDSAIPVRRCVDPFGGSGTTGLACQFLGIHPILIEVNPYLADLIKAKLFDYPSIDLLNRTLDSIIESSEINEAVDIGSAFGSAPQTLIEPGHNGRWIFDKPVAERILALRYAFQDLDEEANRLFQVLLGAILIKVSNVRISGKGRRYRTAWKERRVESSQVDNLFITLARRAINDIRRFSPRSVMSYDILRGDSRKILGDVAPCELAVFSPPYPNSFDYTDVYNVELWTLGYLDGRQANTTLRSETLSSHVQISRDFGHAPQGSPTLTTNLASLNSRLVELWDRRIPSMIGAYFKELLGVIDNLREILVPHASAWIVVGDSQYAGVKISTATVLQELIENRGWTVQTKEPVRAIQTSPQQGGKKVLNEHLLVLRKEP